MTSPAQALPPATPLPQVVIEETRFEGNEVANTQITVSGLAKLVPSASDHENTVLAVGDVVTVQLDVKVTGIGYDVDKNGLLARTQRVRPIEGAIQIIDVLRARQTKIK